MASDASRQQQQQQQRQEEMVITEVEGVGMGDNNTTSSIAVSVDSASGEVHHHQHQNDSNEINMDLGDIFTVSQHLTEGGGGGGELTLEGDDGGEGMIKIESDSASANAAGGKSGSGAVLPPIPFSFPGQTFDTKCQKLILNVWDFFKKVKKNPDILDEIRTPQERAAAALHISAATIGKIGKNLKRTGKLETPGKKRKRSRPIVDSVNSTDEDVIKNIILEFRNNKVVPTLPMVLAQARERIQFSGGATSFRRVLQRMGFRNLSQKNVVRKTIDGGTTTTLVTTANHPGGGGGAGGLATLKVIKKEVILNEDSSTSHSHPTTYIQLNKPLVTYATASPSSMSHKVQSIQQQQQQQQGTIIGTTISGSGGSSGVLNNSNAISFVSAANNPVQGNSGNQIIQITTNQQSASRNTSGNVVNQPIQLSQENAAALANAVQLNGGPQTFHIIGADNTLRPIQIVYASNIQ